jgi:hypothetical protein
LQKQGKPLIQCVAAAKDALELRAKRVQIQHRLINVEDQDPRLGITARPLLSRTCIAGS